jgi:hypothetical protein
MADSNTLLAYLVPAIATQVEPAATKALAYILNKSNSAMEAFNSLVREKTDHTLASVTRVEAEVTYTTKDEEKGRPDLVGYDTKGEQRIIGEAKFGASLLKGQGSDYLNQLSQNGKSVLMFLVPQYRIDYLWGEVERDIGRGKLESLENEPPGSCRAAPIPDSDSFLMMVSWRDLLEAIGQTVADDGSTTSDVQQLRGLTESMDVEAFCPLGNDEYTRDFARRMRDLRRIYDRVVTRLRDQTWVDMQGLSTSGQPLTGYGRYLKISGKESWFGVFYDLWIKDGVEATPLWLQPYTCSQDVLGQISRALKDLPLIEDPFRRGTRNYIPVRLKKDAALEEVVDCVMAQIKSISDEIAGRQ